MLPALSLVLCLGIQDPGAEKPSGAKKAAAETPAVKTLDDKEVQAVLKAYKDASKDKKASLGKRVQAVQALGKSAHAKLIKPLARAVAKGKGVTVRREAAKGLGRQPAKAARKAIVKLLGDKGIQSQPQIAADLVTSLDNAGYTKADWKLLHKLFHQGYTEEHRPKQKAILVLARNHKETQALRMLLENIDEPGPDNVNSASNPPAEYWEKRWKSWAAWRDDVKAALFAITGQRFNTRKEAEAWLRKNKVRR